MDRTRLAFLQKAVVWRRQRLSKLRKPYLKKMGRFGGNDVWVVDGAYVRRNICEDFVNFDHHYHMGFIPKNEFWIEKSDSADESEYYIEHMLAESRLMARGARYKKAYRIGAIAERKMRRKSPEIKKLRKDKRSAKKAVRRKLMRKQKGLRVWLVGGGLVRGLFLTDFAGGGHDRIYSFIPEGEIWIDDGICKSERSLMMLHELHERRLMERGWNYGYAHKSATMMEDFYRKSPRNLKAALRHEMRKQ